MLGKKLREEDPLKVPPPKRTIEATAKNDLLTRYLARINEGTSEDPASITEHLKGI